MYICIDLYVHTYGYWILMEIAADTLVFFDTSRPRHIDRHCALEFVWCPVNNKPPLVQIMAWHQTGDMPLSASTVAQFTDTYMGYMSLGLRELKYWIAPDMSC